jgi:phosphatidyl-myo-inositol dimannoside synthase
MENLLLVTSNFIPMHGGVARYYAGLSAELPELTVLTSVPGEATPRVRRRAWRWGLWPHWLPLLWVVPKVRREVGAALVAAGQLLPVGTALWLIKCLTGQKYAVFVHGLDVALTQASTWKRFLVRQVLAGASLVVVNSEFTSSLARAAGSSQVSTVVVHPSLYLPTSNDPGRTAELRKQFKLGNNLVLLTTCRLVHRKGVASVLAALPDLIKTFSNLTYVVVGDGPERARLEEQARQGNLPVVFVGSVDDETLAAWYQACDVFVLTPEPDPVDVEGFGTVYLEAQACGKPVIGSRVGGVPEAVGEGGVLISSSSEFVSACERLLADPELRRNLGARGQLRAQGFTAAAQAAKLKHYLYASPKN